jgi:hypothetical protein
MLVENGLVLRDPLIITNIFALAGVAGSKRSNSGQTLVPGGGTETQPGRGTGSRAYSFSRFVLWRPTISTEDGGAASR